MDKETRRRNAEARRAWREAKAAERERDKALVLGALRAVLQDPEATTEQRLYAVTVLDHMEHYSFVPYDVKHPGKTDSEIVTEFARELEATQKKDTE